MVAVVVVVVAPQSGRLVLVRNHEKMLSDSYCATRLVADSRG